MERIIREMEETLAALEKEEQNCRQHKQNLTKKRALEACLWGKEHANLVKRVAYVIFNLISSPYSLFD